MAPTLPRLNVARMRSYTFRLPLFTRLVVLIITLLWFVSIQTFWNVQVSTELKPSLISLASGMYRTNTYPLAHAGFIHAFLNTIALVPLLERFEAEHGTLTTLALFFGPLSTIPAVLYIILEKFILRRDTAILGASVWVFMLLAMEAIKTYKTNPHLSIGDTKIPTWTTPLILLVFVTVLVPHTSFLGHLCGLAVGYLFGLGYLRFLAPPEWALRWIEGKMNLLGRLPHYVSVDQKTYGRFGMLPTNSASAGIALENASPTYTGNTQRLGP